MARPPLCPGMPHGGLPLAIALLAACGPSSLPLPRLPCPEPVRPDLAVVGPAFAPPGGGQPFRRFIADRSFMHRYLYNGDDLFPKQVNLCARGRSTLLDLDLGPGAGDALGLRGPAWEAHLNAVALARDPERPLDGAGRTRFVYAWPAVSTAQLDRLLEAHALGRAALEGGRRWERAGALRRRTGFEAMRSLVRTTSAPAMTGPEAAERARAVHWARALLGALLERLWSSVEHLPTAPLGLATPGREAYVALVEPFLALEDASEAGLRRFVEALEKSALAAGTLFDSRRFRRFHEETLLADLGPAWRHGRVSVDQLHAIIAQLELQVARAGSAPLRGLLRRARREVARLRFVLSEQALPELDEARRHHGAEKLNQERRTYQSLKRDIDEARARLSSLARRSFTPAVRRRLHHLLRAGDDPLVAGSFYFETEHLLETTSGFTHAGIIKRLEDPEGGLSRLWMFDRVLGFHYAYPVAKLTHSVPVEVLALSRSRPGARQYHWVRLRVPDRFDLGGGHVSDRVTLENLFAHLKERLRSCPALGTRPGFYYSAISWITAHPSNLLTLADLWMSRVHTGYGYRALHPERLQWLKGRILFLPVRFDPRAAWTTACPPRLSGPKVVP